MNSERNGDQTMNRRLTTGILITTLIGGAAAATAVWSDDDGEHGIARWWREARHDVAAVNNPAYEQECGSCHLAYPPGLLPGESWRRIMEGLEQHFGDDATLDADTRDRLTNYLLANGADRSGYRRSRAIARSVGNGEAPLRITDTPYFRREHHEIPPALVVGNDQVRSFARCEACHARAKEGSFNELEVNIAGVGQWDD
jgi:hypothetical protein